ncbi:MAG: pyruvate dehydrogenase [Deltaproteobacteria bacterium]|nr:MAG: pyruvate dehydrogenase [Deltaproteobacteria bacterium]
MKPLLSSGSTKPRPVHFSCETGLLDAIQKRLLWLSTYMVHHANKLRAAPGGIKVGGHQASSASVVTIMTALFFDFMRRGDRIAVKPHASPVLHAIHYLLGNLDQRYLTTLREYHGLQAYPSRTKDPDPVDFSMGSVGLGAVAPNFAALVERYAAAHFGGGEQRRFISLVGDAELDEGSIWEAAAEPLLAQLDNVLWVVDLNRQSLDRVVPGIRVTQLEEMFRANGWRIVEAKYGRLLQAAFKRPGGKELRRAIDEMPNEQYQFLLRASARTVREVLGEPTAGYSDEELLPLFRDLGGHDFEVLREAFSAADQSGEPAVVFAYTIKGWGLPIAGDPLNHSALLSSEEIASLAEELGVDPQEPWGGFAADSPEAELCRRRAKELFAPVALSPSSIDVPHELGDHYAGLISTQRAFGQILTSLARRAPDIAARVVTVSPDVSVSTNLGGWINKIGVWSDIEESDPFLNLGPRVIRWQRSRKGQHIELGISETNLLMMLGQLGLAAEMIGEPLLPIGTLYDPFVARALDAYIYSVYSGGRFILVGTPSGVTLAPEGGVHQSVITPNIGLALPNVAYYEPCFGLELEWILLAAMRRLHAGNESVSAYIRLSTAPVDQSLLPTDDRERLRRDVLSGAYTLLDRSHEAGYSPGRNVVDIWATGIMVPQAVRASNELLQDSIHANVVNCVSPDLIYRAWQGTVHSTIDHTDASLPPLTARGPVITVIDGHPSALAWVGSMLGVRSWPLGVTRFGESGTPDELYAACQIDWQSIASACRAAVGN